jgi:hypothetical protein
MHAETGPDVCFAAMKSALHTLAANIASSMSLWATLRVRGMIFSIRPLSSQTIWVSVVSKSTAPRFAGLQQVHW